MSSGMISYIRAGLSCQLTLKSPTQNISSGDPAKYFLHPSLVIYFSPTPPVKLKLGLQMRGKRLLIATHLAQSNHLVDQQQVVGFAVPFTSLFILCENAASKPFC
jgi:hypothetical protein